MLNLLKTASNICEICSVNSQTTCIMDSAGLYKIERGDNVRNTKDHFILPMAGHEQQLKNC